MLTSIACEIMRPLHSRGHPFLAGLSRGIFTVSENPRALHVKRYPSPVHF